MTTKTQTKFCILMLGMVFIACSKRTENCKSNETCESTGGVYAGASSQGGSETGGSNEGGGGVGGTNGGESSTGGTTTIPCNGACSGSKPVCNVATNVCVECVSKTDCSDPLKPVCNSANVCVGCVEGKDCSTDPLRRVCDTETSTCVGCLSTQSCNADPFNHVCNTTTKMCVSCMTNTDCPTATASRCDTATNTCGVCQVDADCSQVPGKTVCLPGVSGQPNQCVQCTGKKYGACGQLNGKALACESASNTCSVDKTVQSAGLCQPCTSDAQCTAGKLCYAETFGGNVVGHFCFWKRGDTANGAPATCSDASSRPYVKVESDVTSIDGDVATLCTLRATTCTAYNQFSNLDCAPTGTPQDALCGFSAGVDSKCVLFDANYRCTTACASPEDCDFTCNLGASPKICTFQ